MTDPGHPHPVPGPRRTSTDPRPAVDESVQHDPVQAPPVDSRFADLAERPVAEHVAVYEAEHERLQRDLSTIDQL